MNPMLWRMIWMTGAAALVAVPFVLPQVRHTLWQLANQREISQTHLENLQKRVANLLLACERLLDGSRPEETIMYKLVEAYGGTADPIVKLRVEEWLRRSQLALGNVYAIRRQLLREDVQSQRTLTTLIADWEMLYLTLVGNQKRVLDLTEDELHILLDPIEVLERSPADVQLADQLTQIHRDMQNKPLKITLHAKPSGKVDAYGILGYIDLVEEEIAKWQAKSHTIQAQQTQEQEMRISRLTHEPADEQTFIPGRRLTISERLASLRQEGYDEFNE